ncbi:MAG TPA: lipid A export permease/ATP-binding protein MsbA [Burkholderiales bacterium]|nr:lipid A export permease/ATP-binding protein MsbA [Burkholderiales bacterium]
MAEKKGDQSAPLDSARLYLRLLRYVQPYRMVFALGILGMALASLTEPLFPAIMKPLLDDGFSGKHFSSSLYWLPAALVGVFVLRGAINFCTSYALAWVSNHILLDMREAMFARMVKLPTTFYNNATSGVLISRITFDVNNVTSAATTVLTALVGDTVTVIGLFAYLFYESWALTLVALAIVPCTAMVIRVFSGRLRRVSRGAQHAMGDITHVLGETIEAHKVVKVYGGQEYEKNRFHQANARLRGMNMRQTVAASATVPITQFFGSTAMAVVISIAIYQAAGGQTTVGGFVAFITAMGMLLQPLKRLADVNAPLQRGLAAAESVFVLLDELEEEDNGTRTIARAQGALRFDTVVFRYPNAERAAIDRLSFDIAPGETVALVGTSGGGKTTVANLIPRFYKPQSGTISLDGINIEDLTLESLRANLAFVSQDVVLFNDTIAANIAYGLKRNVSREEITKAATDADAMKFISEQPQGLDTLIGENGVRLSGGQRQRLSIARALLKDAPLLILDEATSALDTETERTVQAALNVLMQNRTTIVIAHRLSTIEKADRILVIDRGHVVESGAHAQLMAHNGIYAGLHRLTDAQDHHTGANTSPTLDDAPA